MKSSSDLTYAGRLRRRVRVLWCVAALMLAYMVIVGETGGDSRIMSQLAQIVSRVIFFGGLAWVAAAIVRTNKLLKNRAAMRESQLQELDERNRYLHDKSGGTVMDILLLILLFTTLTAALYNMPAFYTSFALLAAAVLLKGGAYLHYSRASKE